VQALKNKRKENFLVIDVFFNELFDATTSQFLPLQLCVILAARGFVSFAAAGSRFWNDFSVVLRSE